MSGLIDTHRSLLAPQHLRAELLYERKLLVHQCGEVCSGVCREDQQRVCAPLEREGPVRRSTRPHITELWCASRHADAEFLREQREVGAVNPERSEPRVRERHVHPGGGEQRGLCTGALCHGATSAVERRHFGSGCNLRTYGLDPRATGGSGGERERQKGLVVLVEPAEDVALNVAQVERRGRGSRRRGRRGRRCRPSRGCACK
uniref:Unannotated protein n=1 Tax=freshwater metagenome TaxID=449393 RepID=A0A6J7Q9U1_9ZZZZ